VLRTLINTGISIDRRRSAPIVYLRYRFQIMQGTNPDGSHYADPVATSPTSTAAPRPLHYFPRALTAIRRAWACVEAADERGPSEPGRI